MPEVSLPGYYNLQVFNTDGTPAESSRLYTYAPGTTTHKAAYTDSAGSTAHTYTNDGLGGQYIALNARGELPAPLWLAVGGYDLTLKTPAGATVWTRRAEGSEEVPTANRPMGGFKHTGAANASTSGEYIVWGQAATLDDITAVDVTASGAVSAGTTMTAGGNITATAGNVRAQGVRLGAEQQITGTTTITLENINVDTTSSGGKLVVVNGSDSGGNAFCALYVLATRPAAGAGTQLTATAVSRVGSSAPTLTFAVSGTSVTLQTGASAGVAYVFTLGY